MQVCKKNRIFLCFLLGGLSQVHLTGGRVRGKYGMAMVWQRSGFEVVTRKEAERSMTNKGRKYIRDSFDNNSIILRISYVYVTYILRN